MTRRLMFAALLAVLSLSACSSVAAKPGPAVTPGPGTVLDPPREVGDFTLTSHTGEPLRLNDLRGRVVLIFFGYTYCPDVCPVTLGDFKRVKQALGAEAERVVFVFISVDGERDTPERLAQYVGAFDPDFIGLTGDDATLRTIAKDYGVFYQRESYDKPNYLVTHTASTFVLDADGRLRLIYPYATDAALVAEGVRKLLD